MAEQGLTFNGELALCLKTVAGGQSKNLQPGPGLPALLSG
jgi:hypothetical protein